MTYPSEGNLAVDGAQPRQATLGQSLRSQVGWHLLGPFLVSVLLSVVLFTHGAVWNQGHRRLARFWSAAGGLDTM